MCLGIDLGEVHLLTSSRLSAESQASLVHLPLTVMINQFPGRDSGMKIGGQFEFRPSEAFLSAAYHLGKDRCCEPAYLGSSSVLMMADFS